MEVRMSGYPNISLCLQNGTSFTQLRSVECALRNFHCTRVYCPIWKSKLRFWNFDILFWWCFLVSHVSLAHHRWWKSVSIYRFTHVKLLEPQCLLRRFILSLVKYEFNFQSYFYVESHWQWRRALQPRKLSELKIFRIATYCFRVPRLRSRSQHNRNNYCSFQCE